MSMIAKSIAYIRRHWQHLDQISLQGYLIIFTPFFYSHFANKRSTYRFFSYFPKIAQSDRKTRIFQAHYHCSGAHNNCYIIWYRCRHRWHRYVSFLPGRYSFLYTDLTRLKNINANDRHFWCFSTVTDESYESARWRIREDIIS